MRQNLFDELPCPRKTQTEPIFSIDCFDGKPKEHIKNIVMPATVAKRSKQV